MYPEYILKKLRQRRDLAENDCSQDEALNNLSPRVAFREVCLWEGLIGYDATILGWVEGIFGVSLDYEGASKLSVSVDWDEVPHPGGFH